MFTTQTLDEKLQMQQQDMPLEHRHGPPQLMAPPGVGAVIDMITAEPMREEHTSILNFAATPEGDFPLLSTKWKRSSCLTASQITSSSTGTLTRCSETAGLLCRRASIALLPNHGGGAIEDNAPHLCRYRKQCFVVQFADYEIVVRGTWQEDSAFHFQNSPVLD